MYDLLSDTKDKVWDGYCDQAYDDLKCMLTNETVLALPNLDHPFELCTDACDTGIGAVLQQTIDGATRPLGYFSRHLNLTMQKYNLPLYCVLLQFMDDNRILDQQGHETLRWLHNIITNNINKNEIDLSNLSQVQKFCLKLVYHFQ